MKLVSYKVPGRAETRLGWIEAGFVVDAQMAAQMVQRHLPAAMLELLQLEDTGMRDALFTFNEFRRRGLDFTRENSLTCIYSVEDAVLLPPLPNPTSFRDFYAFEQHVQTARARRGLEMIPEWYDFPAFYFSNHQSMHGPDAVIKQPANTEKLDFELEVACVIGRRGQNLSLEEAQSHIAGFMILNDWSARDIQRHEMKVGLGPAKGKDFATSIGPWLVTCDELEDHRSAKGYDLTMTARVNGKELSRGNFKDLHWSFAEMIVRASQDTMLYPGDIIGSGTVGTGCILELGPERADWLKPGDVVELEIERLGILRNFIG